MKFFLQLFMFFLSISVFSQEILKGIILDETTKEPLPFATIYIFPSQKYTITNEDGLFEIKENIKFDSIQISYIGFNTKFISLSYLKNNEKVFLLPKTFELDEVVINSKIDKNYISKLLSQVIEKYRVNENITESKSYYSLTSSYENRPLEHVEVFYNSKQNLAHGIIDLNVKSGRFGQNKNFSFYSLNNTAILKDFNLFKKRRQLLPSYPGNMSYSSIKNNYNLQRENCNYCGESDLLVSFKPKKIDGQLFSGKILFNKDELVIKKIELTSNNPKINGLTSIVENEKILFREINLNILFNPLDLNKIQYFNFTFNIQYFKDFYSNLIESNGLLYFYEHDSAFVEPYFTEKISFNNDYDNLMVLQSTNRFWELNNPFPKNQKEKIALEYFKKFGYLINYDNTIPKNYIDLIKPSVIEWSNNERLSWAEINQTNTNENRSTSHQDLISGGKIKVNKITYNEVDFKTKRDVLKFSYVLDVFKNENDKNQFIIKTLFDKKASVFNNNRTTNKLVYINIMFDIYEYFKQEIPNEITSDTSFEEVKFLCDKKFKEAEKAINRFNDDTNLGNDYQNLMQWNNSIKSKLNIDNYSLIQNNENEK